MDFESDPNKSKSNKVKHGIDVREAQALCKDSLLLEIELRSFDESRFLIIGKIVGFTEVPLLLIEVIKRELFLQDDLEKRR